jgi:uncharacterized protein YukE
MTGFKVVPQALRDNVKFLQDASDAWESAHNALNGKDLGANDIGLLGRASGAVRYHNEALHDVIDKLKKGSAVLEDAANKLKVIAEDYESRDARYYRKFGYLDK